MAEKRTSRHPKDFNEVAFAVAQIATGNAPKPEAPKQKKLRAITLGQMTKAEHPIKPRGK